MLTRHKKIKKIIINSVFLILLFPIVTSLQITEIMYNPSYSNAYNEYIEIYNDGTEEVELGACQLCGDNISAGYINNSDASEEKTYKESTLIIQPRDCALITDGGSGTQVYQNFETQGIAAHVEKGSLCSRGLSNSGEEITLQCPEAEISVNYAPDAEETQSLQLIGKNWESKDPSPGTYLFNIENNTPTQQNPKQNSKKQPETPKEKPSQKPNTTSQPKIQQNYKSEINENSKQIQKLGNKITNMEKQIKAIAKSENEQPNKKTGEIIYQSKEKENSKLPNLLLLMVSIILNVLLIIYVLKS